MPRKRGGGRHRARKKGNLGNKRDLVYKEEGQEYAQCLKLLGSGRMKVHCFDGKERMAKIRGKFKKRVWVNLGDVVLVQKREFTTDDDNCDVVHVYYSDEVKRLKNFGELPNDLKVNEKSNDDKGNLNIEFGDEEAEEEIKQEKKQPKQKSNWEDLMPSDSSDEEEEEQESITKVDNNNKQQDTKQQQNNNKQQKKVKFEVEEEESDSESEQEKDELDDI